jgi:hypothetical protein
VEIGEAGLQMAAAFASGAHVRKYAPVLTRHHFRRSLADYIGRLGVGNNWMLPAVLAI